HAAASALAILAVSTASQAAEVEVYFGCGCFWHMQHGFAEFEMSELQRQGEAITSRTAYAGGTKVGADGLV
ncbi:unnamed protein product, partial [Polarella glacialis]